MEKFIIEVPDEILIDLKARLKNIRWPDEVVLSGWKYGANLSYLKELTEYWLNDFDWKKQEETLNRLPQFRTEIDGLNIHFIYVKGNEINSIPIIITNGWPSSFAEMYEVVDLLTNPKKYGSDESDSFDVVVPSIPGFGFSERPIMPGMLQVDKLWRRLMIDKLGYNRFMAHGTDIGARITSALGRFHSDVVSGIHIGSVDLEWPDPLPLVAELSDAEKNYLERTARWEKQEGAYSSIQGTYPQTVAYGLNDSPVGLAAWIIEKFYLWSECNGQLESRFSKDILLTNIMIYWITETINSSMRRYYEAYHDINFKPLKPGERIETPTAIAMFPGEKELVVPREWAERCYNIKRWTEMPSGGHFPALEEPFLLVEDIRAFARNFR
jgi:pimeloyl-ACP methyl ester carboxylesterase